MAIYLGTSTPLVVRSSDKIWRLYIPDQQIPVIYVRLISNDKFILKDSNGVYLTAKGN